MDKLSDKIKYVINNKYAEYPEEYGYLLGLEEYLPEIEKLEAEKEELINNLINICVDKCNLYKYPNKEICKLCFSNKSIDIIEKHKGKTWNQITKEKE